MDVLPARDTDHTATLKEAEFGLNLGYGVTVVTAMFFVILGAYTMYGSGDGMLAGSGVSFAQKLIALHRRHGRLGGLVIIPAAFSAMFSTTLTCSMPTPAALRRSRACCVITTVVIRALHAASLRYLGDRAFPGRRPGVGGGQERRGEGFVFGAMTGSFPRLLFCLDGDGHDQQPGSVEHRYGRLTRGFCWFGRRFSQASAAVHCPLFIGLGG